MAHYLVTGGAGFIGSHLAEELVRRGTPGPRRRFPDHRQAQQSRSHPRASSSSKATSPISTSPGTPWTACDYVLHQAAIPSVPRSVKDPITSNRANVDATLNVLVAARDAGVKRLVFAGSSSAYGDTPTLPKHEDMPTNPLSPYALQKLVGEQYLQMFTRLYGLETVSDPLLQRVRAAAGSRRRRTPASSRCSRPRCSRTVRRRSTATASRRATSPMSPTSSTACCALRGAAGASGEVINVATGGRISLNQLFEEMRKLVGADRRRPIYAGTRGGRRPGFAGRHHEGARRCSATSRSCRFEEGLREDDRVVSDGSKRHRRGKRFVGNRPPHLPAIPAADNASHSRKLTVHT